MPMIKTEKMPGRTRNRPLKDYAGTRRGRLLVLSLVRRDAADNNHKWLCRCDCGTEKAMGIKSIMAGKTQSCGCILREVTIARNKTHGKSGVPGYRSWKDMRSRCYNIKDSDYPGYGGRGITVCERWSSFELFFEDMGERPEGMTIDRIDVNGNYEKANCRWATDKTQANNKRSNHVVEWNGVAKNLQHWCDEFGINPSKARYRLKQGWAPDKVFSKEDYRK